MTNLNIKTTARHDVIKIIREARFRCGEDELGMVIFLETKAKEYIKIASRLKDSAIRNLNLLIAREIVRVRERLIETAIFG